MGLFNRSKLLLLILPGLLISCQNGTDSSGQMAMSSLGTVSQIARLKISLVDAPSDNLKEVHVNIKHFEILLAGAGKKGRVIFGEGMGDVDLLTLQHGVQLPLSEIRVPDGLQIQQIRMVLEEDGHYSVRSDDSICEMKTPSAQRTGVKIILAHKWNFESDHDYELVLDFDAKNSVVQQGNGNCLLKPVLKLKSATRKAWEPVPTPSPTPGDITPEPTPDDEVFDLIGGEEVTNEGEFSDGFDDGGDSGEPLVDPDDLDAFFDLNLQ